MATPAATSMDAIDNSQPGTTQRRWWQEPLLWFALVGALLFWFSGEIDQSANNRIELTPQVQQRIADQWQVQMGREPKPEELQGLIDNWVKEEIYYREALRLGLDSNDTIVRRRMVQKLTFLTEDIATAEEPTTAALDDYYQSHLADYQQPARFSFRHRYFSADRRDDAETDATQALAKLADAPAQGEATRTLGDPFMLQLAFAERSQRQIADLFGREFGEALVQLPPEQWAGPIRSAYGWHLIFITANTEPRQQPLAEVTERVKADLMLATRQQANQQY